MMNNPAVGSVIELYRSSHIQDHIGVEREFKKKIQAVWRRAARLSGEEMKISCPTVCTKLDNNYVKDAMQACRAMACDLGMDKFNLGRKLVKKSMIAPDHPFKIGLFFDDLGDEGFSNVMRRIGLRSMDEIFGRISREEKLQFYIPDWGRALLRCTEEKIRLMEMYRVKERILDYRVVSMILDIDEGHPDASTAILSDYIKDYLSEVDIGQSRMNEISLYEGEYIDGVVAKKEGDCLVVYLFIRTPEFYTWYIGALEVIKETIEFVLKQAKKDDCYLLWRDDIIEVQSQDN